MRERPRVAIVLAAGMGTRMDDPDLPKPLVAIGGRPMLERVLEGLAEAGFRRVVLVVGYKSELIESRYGRSFASLRLEYVQQPSQDGTADAIACARRAVGDDAALVTFADILVTSSWYEMLATAWTLRDVVALTTVIQGNPSVGALVEFDDALMMRRFVEKPPDRFHGWADGGVSIMAPEALDAMVRVEASTRGEKEIADAWQALLAAQRPIGIEKYIGAWMDLGTPELVAEAERRYPELLSP